MIELHVSELDQDLAVLGVAQETLSRAEEQLERARLPYTHAIQVLTEAMEQDGNVLQALEMRDEYKDLYAQAEEKVQDGALSAWMNHLTQDKKEWSQGEWELRLRTTKTPIIRSGYLVNFLMHVGRLGAIGALVKKVTLNKADTVSLHGKVDGGLEGLDIEEKTTCSVKRRSE